MTMFGRRAGTALATMVCVLMLAEPALAAGGIEQVLTSVLNLLNSNVIRLVATLAVMGIGFGWMFGQVDIRTAGFFVIGLGIVFGASTIVTSLMGS